VALLLEKGADFTVKFKSNTTALLYAIKQRSKDIIQLLIKYYFQQKILLEEIVIEELIAQKETQIIENYIENNREEEGHIRKHIKSMQAEQFFPNIICGLEDDKKTDFMSLEEAVGGGLLRAFSEEELSF
jgi:ankyrin repeat protein